MKQPWLKSRSPILIFCIVLSLVFALLSAGLGALTIGAGQIVGIILDSLGFDSGIEYEEHQFLVFTAIRLPRLIFGFVSGAVIALCGAVLQGLFRNPLADPGLLGISSGATLSVALVIVLGASVKAALGYWAIPAAAILGSLGTAILVYAFSLKAGRVDTTSLLLVGLAISSLSSAGTGLLIAIARDAELRDITFWTLGSLGGITWETMTPALILMAPTLVLVPWMAPKLNVLLLGERDALNLGVPVEAVKVLSVGVTAAGVGAATALSGVIGFIGLMAPHLARFLVGTDHRWLLPCAAFLGAALCVGADLLARLLVSPAELPLGVVTALIGSPFFLSLVLRRRGTKGIQ